MQYQIIENYCAQYREDGEWKYLQTFAGIMSGYVPSSFKTKKKALKALTKKCKEIKNARRVGVVKEGIM